MIIQAPEGFELLSDATMRTGRILSLHHTDWVNELQTLIDQDNDELGPAMFTAIEMIISRFISMLIAKGGLWAWNMKDDPILITKVANRPLGHTLKSETVNYMTGEIEVDLELAQNTATAHGFHLTKIGEMFSGYIALVPTKDFEALCSILSNNLMQEMPIPVSISEHNGVPPKDFYLKESIKILETHCKANPNDPKLTKAARTYAQQIIEKNGLKVSNSTAGRALKAITLNK